MVTLRYGDVEAGTDPLVERLSAAVARQEWGAGFADHGGTPAPGRGEAGLVKSSEMGGHRLAIDDSKQASTSWRQMFPDTYSAPLN